MPIYRPFLDDEQKQAYGDQARVYNDPHGFETALPSEFALEKQGVRSETGGVQHYQSGSIYDARPGEVVWLDNVPLVSPADGTQSVSLPAVTGEGSQGAAASVFTAYIPRPGGQVQVLVIQATPSESEAPLDPSRAAEAAQNPNIVTQVDEAEKSPEGGETSVNKTTDSSGDKPAVVEPSTDDGIDEYSRIAYQNSDFGSYTNDGVEPW